MTEKYRIDVDDTGYDVAVTDGDEPGELHVEVDGVAFRVRAEVLDAPGSRAAEVEQTSVQRRESVKLSAGEAIRAPMPGTILEVHVKKGQKLEAGDAMLTIESMKMESQLVAPGAGTVSAVHVDGGARVASGDLLVEMEP